MTDLQINRYNEPEVRKKAFWHVKATGRHLYPFSATHNGSTMAGESSYKLSDAEANTLLFFAKWAAT